MYNKNTNGHKQDHAIALSTAADEAVDKAEKVQKATLDELSTLNKKMLMGKLKLEHW
jgi:hypothetical protein